ncbi:hypothetical protein EBZ39_07260 [bacterium]|nr:hypothetical protein [bacterium]
MSSLTTLNGALRLDNGSLVLSNPNNSPCCCGCRPDQLGDAKITLEANHCCGCAKFKFYVNDVFIKDTNLNGCGNITDTFNADISRGATVDENCCLVEFRLKCNSSPSDPFDPSFNGFRTCFDQFGFYGAPPCHTNITVVTVTLPNGTVLNAGILPDDQNTPLRICPENLELKALPQTFACATEDQNTPLDSDTVACSCCGRAVKHLKHLRLNPHSGVGQITWNLVCWYLFGRTDVPVWPELVSYVRAADLVPLESWDRNRNTLFEILAYQARVHTIPIDERVVRIIVRRALSLAAAASKNG